jgi:hypothetical protein
MIIGVIMDGNNFAAWAQANNMFGPGFDPWKSNHRTGRTYHQQGFKVDDPSPVRYKLAGQNDNILDTELVDGVYVVIL